jgi:hypothetical protein
MVVVRCAIFSCTCSTENAGIVGSNRKALVPLAAGR